MLCVLAHPRVCASSAMGGRVLPRFGRFKEGMAPPLSGRVHYCVCFTDSRVKSTPEPIETHGMSWRPVGSRGALQESPWYVPRKPTVSRRTFRFHRRTPRAPGRTRGIPQNLTDTTMHPTGKTFRGTSHELSR